jgi:hypothetical protein
MSARQVANALHVVLLKNRQRQVVRIRSLGQLRSSWQVDHSR